MRIAILWTGISGYSTACWQRLAEVRGVELRVHAIGSGVSVANTAFQKNGGAGVDLRLHRESALSAPSLIQDLESFRPDLTMVAGWRVDAYNEAVRSSAVRRGRVAVAVDNPWKRTARQRVSSILNRRHLRRVDIVLVPGERALQFARSAGVPLSRIRTGMYAFDDQLFYPEPTPERPPPRFLFLGRYVPSKGIRTLLTAAEAYCSSNSDPWGFAFAGTGPMQVHIEAAPFAKNAGFVQPKRLPDLIRSSGALVLPSFHEHWGVVVAEALACGRPVICSDTTGSVPELIRHQHNGLLFRAGDVEDLTRALVACSADGSRWRRWAQEAPGMAAAFTSTRWAERICDLADGA